MKPAIEVENISKKFRIHSNRDPYLSLRDSVQHLFRKTSKEDFYALKDVSFNVQQGESLGIIGKNGAGKSTLLKIISKITPPTSGSITYRGRVASLLEVGTGFHSELTGRENVYMNGSILGMKRSEINKNFDGIVDFAGVEKFIDTPLKHYSSGMQLRLAFAVAAFLENEILIIDEVLAVGDSEFQKKCIGKMDEVSKSGRTLLFVSHNMSALQTLCTRGLLLQNSTVQYQGDVQNAIELYNENFVSGSTVFDLESVNRSRGARFALLKQLSLDSSVYYPDSPVRIGLKLRKNSDVELNTIHLAVLIYDSLGNIVYHLATMFSDQANIPFSEEMEYTFKIPKIGLNAGVYRVTCWLQGNGFEQDYVDTNICFEVGEGNIHGTNSSKVLGIVQKEFEFSFT
jgi:lipopolysaccharide transport system ATP-binding protein